MNQNKLLLLVLLIGHLLLSSFRFEEVYPLRSISLKSDDYFIALDSITNHYLAQNISPHNKVWNLHKALVKRLKRAGIDTVLYYQDGCVGCETLPTRGEVGQLNRNCQCAEDESTVYLFWRDRGKTLFKELECCRNRPIVAGNKAVIDFYFQNRIYFQAGDKFFRDFDAYNRNHPKSVKFLPPTSIHDDVTHMLFYLKNQKLQFEIRKADFTESGSPKYLHYTWKRKQWDWVSLVRKSVVKQ